MAVLQTVKISDLDQSSIDTENDFIEVSRNNGDSTFDSFKIPVSEIGGGGVAIGQGVLQAKSIPAPEGFLDALGYDFFDSEYPDLAPFMQSTFANAFTSANEVGFPYSPGGGAEIGTIKVIDASKDGSILAFISSKSGGDTLTVYQTSDWSYIEANNISFNFPNHIAISPDGLKIATAEKTNDGNNIKIINISDFSQVSVQSIPSNFSIKAISWSYESRYLAIANSQFSSDCVVIDSADGSFQTVLSDSGCDYVEFHPEKPILYEINNSGISIHDYTTSGFVLSNTVPITLSSTIKGVITYNQDSDLTTFIVGSLGSQEIFAIGEDFGDIRIVNSYDLGSGNSLKSIEKYPGSIISFGGSLLISITNREPDFQYKYITYEYDNDFMFFFYSAENTTLPQLIGADAEEIIMRDDFLIYFVSGINNLSGFETNQLKLVRFFGPGSFKINTIIPLTEFKYVIKAR